MSIAQEYSDVIRNISTVLDDISKKGKSPKMTPEQIELFMALLKQKRDCEIALSWNAGPDDLMKIEFLYISPWQVEANIYVKNKLMVTPSLKKTWEKRLLDRLLIVIPHQVANIVYKDADEIGVALKSRKIFPFDTVFAEGSELVLENGSPYPCERLCIIKNDRHADVLGNTIDSIQIQRQLTKEQTHVVHLFSTLIHDYVHGVVKELTV